MSAITDEAALEELCPSFTTGALEQAVNTKQNMIPSNRRMSEE